MDVAPLRDAYPAGDEFILVYDVLGRVVPPGGIPLAVGAVVMNVETAMNVALAGRQPVTEKYLTVAGAVAEPGHAPRAGRRDARPVRGGRRRPDDPRRQLHGRRRDDGHLEDDHDALVDKTTGGVIVLPDDHVVVRRRRQDWRQIARIGRSACDQCSFCTELCPRWLLGHPIEPHKAMRSLGFNLVGEANTIGTAFCCECNLCSLYSCPEDLDPKNVCTQNKRRLAAEKRRWENPPFNPRRPGRHLANRKAPMNRLIQKLGLDPVPQRRAAGRPAPGDRQSRHPPEAARRRPVRAGGQRRRASEEGAAGGPPAAEGRQARPGRPGPRLDRRRRDRHRRRSGVDREESTRVAE